tara:strand:- start:3077 stop:3442 length:366 start_codon:yes stop_codon:yes gene_type:complete
MNKVSNFVWVTFQKEGIHCYPDAAISEKLDDVKFLGYPHRHIFHFKVHLEVFHDDRDVEFIQFKRWCESLYAGDVLEIDHMSCEMLSDELADQISLTYPGRCVIIDVSEDKENGSHAQYEP